MSSNLDFAPGGVRTTINIPNGPKINIRAVNITLPDGRIITAAQQAQAITSLLAFVNTNPISLAQPISDRTTGRKGYEINIDSSAIKPGQSYGGITTAFWSGGAGASLSKDSAAKSTIRNVTGLDAKVDLGPDYNVLTLIPGPITQDAVNAAYAYVFFHEYVGHILGNNHFSLLSSPDFAYEVGFELAKVWRDSSGKPIPGLASTLEEDFKSRQGEGFIFQPGLSVTPVQNYRTFVPTNFLFPDPVRNDRVTITVDVLGFAGETPPTSPEVTQTLVDQGIVVRLPNATVSTGSSLLSSNGYFNTEIASILSGDTRPGNGNLATNTLNLYTVKFDAADPFSLKTSPFLGSASFNNLAGQQFNSTFVDPLVLDLNANGVTLSNFDEHPALFDIDHDGLQEVTGWTDGIDAILVNDLNGNGVIDSIAETFSEFYAGTPGATIGEEGQRRFANGFAALASLDNGNRVFDASDAAFGTVRAWVDANRDGRTDANELKTLASLGITSINLNATTQDGLVRDGNEVLASGSFVRNGTAQEALAVRFLANPDGSSFVTNGTGAVVTTQGGIKSYTAGNVGETIDVAAKGVANAYGGDGDDVLIGDAGNNWLVGSTGADKFIGGAGNDVLLIDVTDLQDDINGGDGIDILQVVGSAGVTIDMARAGVEVARGGGGDDVFLVGNNSNGFARGGAGDDVLIGGGASDALSGEADNDFLNGAGGNDLLRGNAGNDEILGANGDDIVDGGSGDDRISGGLGSDVLIGGQGDDRIDGNEGVDAAQFAGRFSDYRFTKIEGGVLVSDTVSGRDGTDFLLSVEKLTFSDVASVDIDVANPVPINDVVKLAARPTGSFLITSSDLLRNDLDFQTTTGLTIAQVGKAVGGTAAIEGNAIRFTPTPGFTGIMSFRYYVDDAQGNPGLSVVQVSTGANAEIEGIVTITTPDIPTDPGVVDQWYLNATNVIPVWANYSGKGVSIGIFEPGGNYSVGPETFDYRDPDLQPNVSAQWLAQGNVPTVFSAHATSVAGVIGAARNGEGIVGIAHNATLTGRYIQGSGLNVGALEATITSALAEFKNYDVVNNSWGGSRNFQIGITPPILIETGVLDAIRLGRGGLGTIVVFAGGNEREDGGNTNYNQLTNNAAVITVGALNAPDDLGGLQLNAKPFSNPGASILVSAPGSNVTATSQRLLTGNQDVLGSDLEQVAGSSFAAPIVSGVVALMLEANPLLGYRDVQEILSITAKRVDDPNFVGDWRDNKARDWNGGGRHISDNYGYGLVDAAAAVHMAEQWTPQRAAYNGGVLNGTSGTVNRAIPDGGTVAVPGISMAAGLAVEHANIVVNIDHANWGDLIVRLISPNGTVSTLIDRPGVTPGSPTDTGDQGTVTLNVGLGSTQFRGETSGGVWQLQVTDARTGATGIVKDWQLQLSGGVPDLEETYYYTDEFASYGVAAPRATIVDTDTDMRDMINASAVSGPMLINLAPGSTSTIAGRSLTLGATTGIERAIGGSGNDTILANNSTNVLFGGRGNDSISGFGDIDLIDGGFGNDTMSGGTGADYFIIRNNAGDADTIVDFGTTQVGEKLLFTGFGEGFGFADISVSTVAGGILLRFGSNQSLTLQGVSAAAFTEQNTTFLPTAAYLNEYLPYLSNNTVTSVTTGPDNLNLAATFGSLTVFSIDGNDTINAFTLDDLIDGGNGNDFIADGETVVGFDWFEGGAGNDTLLAGDGADIVFGGSGDDAIAGEGGNDIVIGGAGRDFVTGGAGQDLIIADGDMGRVNISTGAVTYGLSGGTDADVFVVLPTVLPTGLTITATDYESPNTIIDFNANERIDFSRIAGVDGFEDLVISTTSIGGFPVTRIVAGSTVVTLDSVSSSSLSAANFIFKARSLTIEGTAGADTLVGDAGGNVIDGKAGIDTMEGRLGDDTYFVDVATDKVIEQANGGYDIVRSGVTYIAPANVEVVELLGTGNTNATGNAEANRLVGNAGANKLDGEAGADDMRGGKGNDTYVVDNANDRVLENDDEGVDAVTSSVSYTLSPSVENLTLSGTAAINGTGNAGANTLTGNAGDNLLNGGAGADTMTGNAGNDVYVVDQSGDNVVEAANAGNDTVFADSNYTLTANVENGALTLGTGGSLTGNALDNVLRGGAGADTLAGLAGNDELLGGDGNDVLEGGDGNDLLEGSAGADRLFGRDGDDTFIISEDGGALWDYYDGGDGNDTASFERFTKGVTVDLRVAPSSNGLSPALPSGATLAPETQVTSPDGKYRLRYQSDGNLVLYAPTGAIWATNTAGTAAHVAAMQGDGNLVVYDTSLRAWWGSYPYVAGSHAYVQNSGRLSVNAPNGAEIWTANGAIKGSGAAKPISMASGTDIYFGQPNVASPNGQFWLQYQSDGNLVLYTHGTALWGSPTIGSSAGRYSMQGDGNFVIYDAGGAPVWNSNTGGNPGAYLSVSDTGHAAIYNGAGQELWSVGYGTDEVYDRRFYGDGWRSIENLTGSNYVDVLTNHNGGGRISGLGGNDTLNGGTGNDTLDGGTGNDRLTGNAGSDIIYGGGGTDTAVYLQNRAAFTITTGSDADGAYTQVALAGGMIDRLYQVENLEFTDQTISAPAAAMMESHSAAASGELVVTELGDASSSARFSNIDPAAPRPTQPKEEITKRLTRADEAGSSPLQPHQSAPIEPDDTFARSIPQPSQGPITTGGRTDHDAASTGQIDTGANVPASDADRAAQLLANQEADTIWSSELPMLGHYGGTGWWRDGGQKRVESEAFAFGSLIGQKEESEKLVDMPQATDRQRLLQAMAAFHGDVGAAPAIWRRQLGEASDAIMATPTWKQNMLDRA